MKELITEAKTENLDAVLEFVETELDAAELNKKLQTHILVAVEEVFVNIAQYAYNSEVGGTTIRLAVGDEVVIEFEDSGKPYNPLESEDPDTTLSAHERKVGGLGVFMVKQIMDAVEYRNASGKNILTIKKNQV
ncbi:MAG: ATP-binding protein [Oscillospiraceae bacterium]|nr:ATP-binding protein [Oscillospiraceae bacterium]MCL2278893.1 ATP-binding protein [Oscillospiraceae bacterium]